MQRAIILILILAFASAGFAAVPQTLSYQGALSDPQGNPLIGTHSITFALYDAETGGDPLWSETHSLEIAQGAFSAILGSDTALDLPFDQQYWLGVTVGDDPELPRTQLTASPYSLNAASAETLGDAVTIDGNLDVRTANALTVGNNLFVGNGYTELQRSYGSPNAGALRFGDNSGWKYHFGRKQESSSEPHNTGDSGAIMTLVDQGQVGIGTTAPQTALDVNGTTQTRGFAMPPGAVSGHVLTTDANGVGTWQAPGAVGEGQIANGSVTGAKLASDLTHNGTLSLSGGTDYHNVKDITDKWTWWIDSHMGPGGVDFYNTLRLKSETDPFALTVMQNGNVGIGLEDPWAKLTVDGTPGEDLLALSHGRHHKWWLSVDGQDRLHFKDAGGDTVIALDQGGYLGVGTAAKVGPLAQALNANPGEVIVGGSNAAFIFGRRSLDEWPADPQAGDNFAWYSPDGTARLWTPYSGDLLTVASNGNVGIGIDTPQAKLDVNGSIRVRSLNTGWNGYDCLLVNADGNVVRAAPSSRRYKTNIDTLRADYRQLLGLQAFTYDYIESGERAFGFMAEDVHEAGLERLVFYDEQGRPDAVNLRVLPIYNTELIKTVAADVAAFDGKLAIAAAPDSALTIDAQGRVGIGSLAVAGTVQAEDIVVSVDRFADHVFADDYALPSLEEVDAFIEMHHHLPGIPSEAQVRRNGLKLGEMDTRLLQKVEELTLYLIDMQKENQALKTRLEALEMR